MPFVRLPPTIPGLLTGVRPVPKIGQASTFETIRANRPSTTVGLLEMTNNHDYTAIILPHDGQPQVVTPTTTQVTTTATSTFTLSTHNILPREATTTATSATMSSNYLSIILPRAAQPQLTNPTTTSATTTATAAATSTTTASVTETLTSTATSISTSTLLTTATPSITSPNIATTTSTATAIYYPPASSHFALSVPVITGIVVAGVGFLVLLAMIAAFTVCFLDRKKETKAQKQERKRQKELVEQEKKRLSSSSATGTATEKSSVVGGVAADAEDGGVGGSVIGPRYASMIGVNTNNDTSTEGNNVAGGAVGGSTQTQEQRGRPRERTIIHLPVHVDDLGTPRQSQMGVQYEREDPDDRDRDERGFRRGASWWHPEL